jgi:uncharacterized coiled-coil DUF342 family protein
VTEYGEGFPPKARRQIEAAKGALLALDEQLAAPPKKPDPMRPPVQDDRVELEMRRSRLREEISQLEARYEFAHVPTADLRATYDDLSVEIEELQEKRSKLGPGTETFARRRVFDQKIKELAAERDPLAPELMARAKEADYDRTMVQVATWYAERDRKDVPTAQLKAELAAEERKIKEDGYDPQSGRLIEAYRAKLKEIEELKATPPTEEEVAQQIATQRPRQGYVLGSWSGLTAHLPDAG